MLLKVLFQGYKNMVVLSFILRAISLKWKKSHDRLFNIFEERSGYTGIMESKGHMQNINIPATLYVHVVSLDSCADPESFVRGGQFWQSFFFNFGSVSHKEE